MVEEVWNRAKLKEGRRIEGRVKTCPGQETVLSRGDAVPFPTMVLVEICEGFSLSSVWECYWLLEFRARHAGVP